MALPQPNDGFAWTQAPWGAVLRCRPLLEIADHFFTAADLQLRDARAEWDQVARAMGVGLDRVLLLRQVHGARVAVARSGEYVAGPRPEADAAATDDSTIAIGVRVADCAPILIGDRRRRVVGAAHAGWRGTVQRAVMAAVSGMQEHFGSRAEDLVAAIGPCLGACCGEVGPEVVDAFREAGHPPDAVVRWLTPGTGDRSVLDLARANRDQLEMAGVPAAHIHVAGLCTRTHATILHSHRSDKERAGRMVGIIRAKAKNADC